MYTFNLGLVFGASEAVIIIVCSSEQPINEEKVNRVATSHFKQSCLDSSQLSQVIAKVVNGIKAECGCDAVTVTADCTCYIPRK